METKRDKVIYLEIIRVIAILLVVYTHSKEMGVHYYRVAPDRISYWVSMLLLPLTQICVPLFFMISGALLLGRRESIKYVYIHRVSRMVLVTALAVLFQYVVKCIEGDATFSFLQFINSVYGGGIKSEQWFLYAYISMLLILPFLQRFAQSITENGYFVYLFVFMIIINGICPMWQSISDFDKITLTTPLLTNIVFYPFMGYYIEQRSGDLFLKKKNVVIMTILALLLAVGNAWMNNHSWVNGQKIVYKDLFVAIYAFVIFVLVRYIDHGKQHGKISTAIWSFLGAGVFGTYIIEEQMRDLFMPVYEFLQNKIYHYPAFVLWLLMVVSGGIVIINIIKLIPGVKNCYRCPYS